MMELLKEWIDRLNLQKWTIKVCDNMHPGDMSESDDMGCVVFDEVNHAARIEILDPAKYGDRIKPFDYEKILVHELLHLKMCFLWGDDELRNRIAHGLLDEIAVALVDAKRSFTKEMFEVQGKEDALGILDEINGRGWLEYADYSNLHSAISIIDVVENGGEGGNG